MVEKRKKNVSRRLVRRKSVIAEKRSRCKSGSTQKANTVTWKVDNIVARIEAHDARAIGRALSLIESPDSALQARGHAVLRALSRPVAPVFCIGISGLPGAGKSSLLNDIVPRFVAKGLRVAVLSIDPSSHDTGGSILGDQARMSDLVGLESVFVRASATSGYLGGLSESSHSAAALLERCGFDLIFIETTGVGQSEMGIRFLADIVILLLTTGGGDALQGIKRGLLEECDIVAISKADGDNASLARAEAAKMASLLRRVHKKSIVSMPLSIQSRASIDMLIEHIDRLRVELFPLIAERRVQQALDVKRRRIASRIRDDFDRYCRNHDLGITSEIETTDIDHVLESFYRSRLGELRRTK